MKLAGFSAPTQDVSGASGAARNDTITACAQGDAGETKCPMPGMLMMVALDSFDAAALAPARDVSVSKLPEMRSVGMLLTTGWCMASGAAGGEPIDAIRRSLEHGHAIGLVAQPVDQRPAVEDNFDVFAGGRVPDRCRQRLRLQLVDQSGKGFFEMRIGGVASRFRRASLEDVAEAVARVLPICGDVVRGGHGVAMPGRLSPRP